VKSIFCAPAGRVKGNVSATSLFAAALVISCAGSNLIDCQTFLEKNQLDPIIGNRSILMHFWIDLIEPVYLPSIIFLFFCISEKLWYKTCCPSGEEPD
jgi:hypothetical protein